MPHATHALPCNDAAAPDVLCTPLPCCAEMQQLLIQILRVAHNGLEYFVNEEETVEELAELAMRLVSEWYGCSWLGAPTGCLQCLQRPPPRKAGERHQCQQSPSRPAHITGGARTPACAFFSR